MSFARNEQREGGPSPVPRGRRVAASAWWTVGCLGAALTVPVIAGEVPALAASASLDQVITNMRNVIVGLLVGLATLFLTIGGFRLLIAGGDAGEVESAKRALRYAALGYGVAVLAPLFVTLLQKIVGS
ncbi:pilin [Actinocorallia sp. A-T 12471]|uniref:pilin n=1 Tax=Actinocorallia sp. A-T 12471 TaxID=3089813 RepID=UPI0029CC92F4|nr:pilin [Actinocorallia sp. A-T 12471]MDX6738148.1 pilin [Actinocorallia sp. A-T 12471]